MKKKSIYCVYLLFIMLSFQHKDAYASNRVTVATIGGGGALVNVGVNQEPQKMTNQIIEFWKGEFGKVMPYHPDLILLTEACDRPGGLTPEEQFKYYKVRKNQVFDYFATVAKANRCYIAFGMKREENGVWWNSCIILDREGKVAGIYNKNFPTIDEMEGGIQASKETPVFQCDFGRVACAICFDLNFDELRVKYEALKPDIILFPSMYHGALEQSKWAYSCRSFFLCSFGVLTAPSEIRNPLGEVVATSTNYFNYAVATINLDRKLVHLDNNWEKLVALKKKYGKDVVVTDPGRLGVVMITSENEKVSADDMIKEFNIELVDDYFNRSRDHRLQQLNLP
ncbi:MAG: carbon-nitrogen hydrolase family protein [Bacteroidales bacterium]|nr:carbon-nitrogen hydrolase family protein [Bacteroidales bacterium]